MIGIASSQHPWLALAVTVQVVNASASISDVTSLPAALLAYGLSAIGAAALIVLVTWMRRRATRQWKGENELLDPSYGATLKRTLYRAARVKWLTYAIVALFVAGVGLLVASGIAELAG
jgi:hypothetical protein